MSPWCPGCCWSAPRRPGAGPRSTAGCGGLGFMLAVHHWLLPSLHVFIVRPRRAAGRAVGAVGLAGAPAAGRGARAAAGRRPRWSCCRAAGWWSSWSAPGRASAGPGACSGPSQWQVAAGAAAGVGRRGVAGQLPGGGGEHRRRRAGRGAAEPRVPAVAGAGRRGRRDLGGLGVGAARPTSAAGCGSRSCSPGVDRRADSATALRPRGAAHPAAGRAGRRPGRVGREQRRLRPRRRGPTSRSGSPRCPARSGADILVNVDARRSDRPGIYKSSVLVGPDGPTGDRLRQDAAGAVRRVRPGPLGCSAGPPRSARRPARTGRRGTEQVVMDVGHGLRVGPLVCFESAFPDMSRHLARRRRATCCSRSRRPRRSSTAGRPRSTPRWPRCAPPRPGARWCTRR